MRPLLLLLIAVNLLTALCTYPLMSMATGAGKLYIVSKYREFDRAGLTNYEALKNYKGGKWSQDWRAIPDDLGEGAFGYVEVMALFFTAAFVGNLLLLVIMLRLSASDGRMVE